MSNTEVQANPGYAVALCALAGILAAVLGAILLIAKAWAL